MFTCGGRDAHRVVDIGILRHHMKPILLRILGDQRRGNQLRDIVLRFITQIILVGQRKEQVVA